MKVYGLRFANEEFSGKEEDLVGVFFKNLAKSVFFLQVLSNN